MATCIAIEWRRDFGSSTIGGFIGGRAGEIAIGAPEEKESWKIKG